MALRKLNGKVIGLMRTQRLFRFKMINFLCTGSCQYVNENTMNTNFERISRIIALPLQNMVEMRNLSDQRVPKNIDSRIIIKNRQSHRILHHTHLVELILLAFSSAPFYLLVAGRLGPHPLQAFYALLVYLPLLYWGISHY